MPSEANANDLSLIIFYFVALVVPVVFVALAGLIRGFVRRFQWELSDFCLGIELILAATASASMHLFVLVSYYDNQQIQNARIQNLQIRIQAANNLHQLFSKLQLGLSLLPLCIIALVALVVFHYGSEPIQKNPSDRLDSSPTPNAGKKLPIILVAISNLVGIGIMFAAEMLWK